MLLLIVLINAEYDVQMYQYIILLSIKKDISKLHNISTSNAKY